MAEVKKGARAAPVKWRSGLRVLGAASIACVLGYACTGHPSYPRCDRDADCARDRRHDYCVDGLCVYCRAATDCGDGEMCRAGRCLADPGLAKVDGGEDASLDAPNDVATPILPARREPTPRIRE